MHSVRFMRKRMQERAILESGFRKMHSVRFIWKHACRSLQSEEHNPESTFRKVHTQARIRKTGQGRKCPESKSGKVIRRGYPERCSGRERARTQAFRNCKEPFIPSSVIQEITIIRNGRMTDFPVAVTHPAGIRIFPGSGIHLLSIVISGATGDRAGNGRRLQGTKPRAIQSVKDTEHAT